MTNQVGKREPSPCICWLDLLMLLYCRYNDSPGRKEGAKSLYLLAGCVNAAVLWILRHQFLVSIAQRPCHRRHIMIDFFYFNLWGHLTLFALKVHKHENLLAQILNS
jgi:hypothetical protein